MKKTIINLTKLVVFLAGLFFILLIAPKVLGISSVSGIKSEPEKSLDYLVIGDSLAYRSISPMQIYKEQGYTGYNLGKPSQFFQNGFYALSLALDDQKPKKVFVETNFIFRERNIKSGVEEAISIITGERLPIFENHNEWKSLIKGEEKGPSGKKKESKDSVKGFNINTNINSYKGIEAITKTDQKKKIPTLTRFYLDKLVELSKEKGFEIVFYSAPSPKNWTYAVHNSIAEYAKENKLEYLDFNLKEKELKIDWSKDTYDRGDHLNLSGARKLTHEIGVYLYKQGTLVDHRNDQAYNNWGKLWMTYNEKTAKK